jgi:hypothetical protein
MKGLIYFSQICLVSMKGLISGFIVYLQHRIRGPIASALLGQDFLFMGCNNLLSNHYIRTSLITWDIGL